MIPALPEVTDLVDRLFCKSGSACYGPYERVGDGVEVIPGTLFRYRALNRAQRDLALQVFTGLGTVPGAMSADLTAGASGVRAGYSSGERLFTD